MYDAGLFCFMLIPPRRAPKDDQSIHIDKYKYIQGVIGDQESPPNEWSLL